MYFESQTTSEAEEEEAEEESPTSPIRQLCASVQSLNYADERSEKRNLIKISERVYTHEDGGRKEKKISQPGTKINVHSHTMGAKKK